MAKREREGKLRSKRERLEEESGGRDKWLISVSFHERTLLIERERESL